MGEDTSLKKIKKKYKKISRDSNYIGLGTGHEDDEAENAA